MGFDFLSRAARFLQERKAYRRWLITFGCLAMVVVFGTVAALKMYGQAMTHQVKVLDCSYQVHEHTEDCYEENEDGEEVLICTYADYVIHVHNDDCYDEKQNLVCPLIEHEPHEHTEDCWEEREILVCEKEETEEESEEPADSSIGEPEEAEAEVQDTTETEESTTDNEKSDVKEETSSELVCESEEHTHDDSCYAEGAGCEKEEHTHGEGCYERELTCEAEEHTHGDGCYTTTEIQTCDRDEHSHDDGCYDEEDNLICEEEEHTHDGGCVETTEELTCTTEEHSHEDSCYTETLVCETEEHTHDDSCEASSELICEKEEHQHDDSCYQETKVKAEEETVPMAEEPAAQEEQLTDKENNTEDQKAEKGHTHTDDCYETETVLVCGEQELHMHDDSCYDESCFDEDGNLIEGSRVSCGLLQLEEHVHSEDCFQIVELTPEEVAALNNGATLHIHNEECFDEEGKLICGYETHIHDLSCYDEEGHLICGHDGEENASEDNSLSSNSLSSNNLPEEEHEHDANCYDIRGNLICGYENAKDHVHTDACYDADGNLICGYEVLEAYDSRKIYECEKYIVAVRYNHDAKIPEEAELIAEEITPDSDEEHYENREAEYREIMRDETASMRALLKIGFYLDGEEIEPETPVAVSIQFLDEDGLAEGSPITVIHFAEEGTERLDGSDAKHNSTSFKIGSFSEIAIGYGTEGSAELVPIHVSNSFEYENESFHITFHIDGDAVPISNNEDIDVVEDIASEDKNEEILTDDETKEDGEENNQEIESSENDELNFQVKPLSEDSEKYEAISAAYIEDSSEEKELFLLQVLSYTLLYKDTELDISNCLVTAEITPTQALIKATEDSTAETKLDLENVDDDEIKSETTISAIGLSHNAEEGEIKGEIIDAVEIDSTPKTMKVALAAEGNENTIGLYVSSQANPPFTVQYYAYLDRAYLGKEQPANTHKALDIIDTSGKELPKNGTTPAVTQMYIDNQGNVIIEDKAKAQEDKKPTEVYKDKSYEYILAPNLTYFDILAKNTSYTLKEVWVLNHRHDRNKCYSHTGDNCTHENDELICAYKDPSTITDLSEWTKKEYIVCGNNNHTHTSDCYLHFTNREKTANENPDKYVLITWDGAVRLVYDTSDEIQNFPSIFYDYDISNGVYETNQFGTVIDTRAAGINSTENCDAEVKYAFGNQNAGTNFGKVEWNGALLNAGNKNSKNPGYGNCTFGLVSGTDGNDVKFNVSAPKVFGLSGQKGKTIFPEGYSLDFIRSGDTYTLTSVKGTTTNKLESFIHTADSSTTGEIWSNNFWPMDAASTWGASGHDIKFGDYDKRLSRKFYPGNSQWGYVLPYSDDKVDHNSYFGMYYEVEFDLDESYSGPLEYLFFGDDDMWVFLDDDTLVCDIGGVHSSVGEYVNLWDYLRNEDGTNKSGKHTLKFFYTERGASGSTCWMQFTLPSVTGIEPPQNFGELKISKTANNMDGEFKFEVSFFDSSNNPTMDDYSYTKYDKDGKVIGNDIIICDGGEFTLKNGEYIIVTLLPLGTQFRITEVDTGECFTDIVTNGNEQKGLTKDKITTGTIQSGQGTVSYLNYYSYQLPETGGFGTMLYTTTGVLCILFGAGFLYRKKFRERRV